MSHFTAIRGVAVAALTLVASSAHAQHELKIMAPAGPRRRLGRGSALACSR